MYTCRRQQTCREICHKILETSIRVSSQASERRVVHRVVTSIGNGVAEDLCLLQQRAHALCFCCLHDIGDKTYVLGFATGRCGCHGTEHTTVLLFAAELHVKPVDGRLNTFAGCCQKRVRKHDGQA